MSKLPDITGGVSDAFSYPLMISVDNGENWISPQVIEYGQGFLIGVGLQNAGEINAENVSMEIRVNSEVLKEKTFTRVKAGKSYVYDYGTFYWEPGEYTIELIYDPENTIQESDETNNVYSCTLRVEDNDIILPDLAPYASQQRSQPVMLQPTGEETWIAPEIVETGSGFQIGFGVKNYGTVMAENIPVQIRINDVIMVDKTIASIPRGGVRSYHFGTYGFDPGEYTISLVMDPYDEIAESDESNNVFSYTFTVPGNQDWLIKPKWTSFENLFGTDILLNEYSPIDPDTGEKCGAGCGNVARTQILAYFASLGYGFTVELTEEDAFLFDGKIAIDGTEENAKANGTISFAEVNRLLEDFDETSAEDVAALCYASAAIIGNGGSNARLFKRIGFKSTTTVYRGKSDLWSADGNLSDKAWEMLIRNVENGQPVITGVPDPHVIIIDGYDAATDMVHINFDFGIANGKRYVEKFGVMRGNGWYTRDELDALELQYFHYDITPDTEKPLAGQVACRISGTCAELSLDFTDDVGVWKKYYRLAGSDEWLEYTDKVTVQYNTTVYFKACDKGKNDSAVTTYTVTGLADPPPVTISGNSQGVSWTSVTDAQKYTVEYSRDNFANIQRFEANTTAVDTYAMPAGTYRWRVKADDGDFVSGSAFTAGKAAAAQKYTSDADGDLDVFFGNADGVWGNGYAAEHQGILNGWKGTGEQIILDGKNRIADVFAGSTDANILVLTDDANGDALFVDDIFTTLGDQARLSQIDEIRAGFGDDIVDMTSQQFTYSGDGVIIYGGSGNDTIWANRGANTLFGDAGNDRIVGGSSDDYIIGGAGNDAMLGGGGNDIFCFGGDWGCDTIEQLANGKVTLWFDEGSASNWNASTLTYTDGTNTVTVSGVTNITLKFGGEAPVNGAFSDAASEKIFEDKNKGMIA